MSRYEGQGDERPLSPPETVQSLSTRRQLRDDEKPRYAGSLSSSPETDAEERETITCNDYHDATRHAYYGWKHARKMERERDAAELQCAAALLEVGRVRAELAIANKRVAELATQIQKVGALIPMVGGGTFANDPPDAILDCLLRSANNGNDTVTAPSWKDRA